MDEYQRLELIAERDGHAAAVEWARRTRDIYRAALDDPDHFAAQPAWRPRFEAAVEQLDAWLGHGKAGQ